MTRAGAVMGLVVLSVASTAWADHGAGLRTEGMSPVWAAVLWAALAFLVGMAVVGIVSVLFRRGRSARGGAP